MDPARTDPDHLLAEVRTQLVRAGLVVDDVVSVRPWKVRGADIRGEAQLPPIRCVRRYAGSASLNPVMPPAKHDPRAPHIGTPP